jgi:hypothetical protein
MRQTQATLMLRSHLRKCTIPKKRHYLGSRQTLRPSTGNVDGYLNSYHNPAGDFQRPRGCTRRRRARPVAPALAGADAELVRLAGCRP